MNRQTELFLTSIKNICNNFLNQLNSDKNYIFNIYKKWNTAYSDTKMDNLKSILLNNENISDVINDLYFKWIIQVTWKKLIDNHRKCFEEDCPNVCWCFLVEDILDSWSFVCVGL